MPGGGKEGLTGLGQTRPDLAFVNGPGMEERSDAPRLERRKMKWPSQSEACMKEERKGSGGAAMKPP